MVSRALIAGEDSSGGKQKWDGVDTSGFLTLALHLPRRVFDIREGIRHGGRRQFAGSSFVYAGHRSKGAYGKVLVNYDPSRAQSF